MKTLFEKSTREELIKRINTLNENSNAQWGKMSEHQMAKHMCIWNEWILGRNSYAYKQELIGKIFGRMMLKKHTKDDTSMSKGMPVGNFAVKEKVGDLEGHKKAWIELVEGYGNYSNPRFIHDFYGKMTKEQIGIFAYKHIDHHLRQFSV